MLNFVLGQRGGGLVEHQDFCIIRNRLGNFNHLSLGYRQIADDRTRIDVDLKILKHFLGIAVHLATIDKAILDRESAKPDIFHYIAAQNLIQLLVNHGDAVIECIAGIGKGYLFPIDLNRAFIFAVDSKQALHQRGLTRAVFTHQGVNGTGTQFQLSMIQGLDARKLLDDTFHLKQVSGLLHSNHRTFSSEL